MSNHKAEIASGADLSLPIDELLLIEEITGRAVERWRFLSPLQVAHDLTVCHKYLVPLRLAELARADYLDLAHDVHGLRENILITAPDHVGGKIKVELCDCFVPRYAESKQLCE